MKPCRRQRTVDRLLAGELSPRRAAAVEAHLRTCERCAAHHETGARLLRAAASRAPTRTETERALAGVLARLDRPAPVVLLAERRRRRPGLLVAGLVAAASAAVVLLIGPGPKVAPEIRPEATLALVEGRVTVSGRPTIAPARLEAGALLEAAPGSAARILLDGAELRVAPGSRLRARGRSVGLESGVVALDVVPGGGELEVRTPDARVVVLGTRFVVEQGPRGTEARVAEGRVRLEGARGATLLEAGQRAHARPGEAPSPPRSYDPATDDLRWGPSSDPGRQPAGGRRPRLREWLGR